MAGFGQRATAGIKDKSRCFHSANWFKNDPGVSINIYSFVRLHGRLRIRHQLSRRCIGPNDKGDPGNNDD